jgi:sterol desaturase/sphingolipid hydroxylase (fatty acid hydroxylase superfamily)
MDVIQGFLIQAVDFVWTGLVGDGSRGNGDFGSFAVGSLVSMGKSYFWFLAGGMVIFAMWVRRPGQRFSLVAGLKYLLPIEVYSKPSVKIDLLMVPISWVLNFTLFAGLSIGSGVMQMWLAQKFGHMPWTVSSLWLAVPLTIVFTLFGTDIARFAWHYQGHRVPFFWEFHKGHHSAEALHPVFIRTHPVDMFIRLAYMNMGGGIIGGGLMYLTGVDASATAAGALVVVNAFINFAQHFEHSHVVFSFGKTLDKIFYPPHFHRIHHSALLEHRDKNLGRTGGLCLWDQLLGTLYIPKDDEHIVYGASMEELGERNPHRTLWGFLAGPFVAAMKTLRRPVSEVAGATPARETVAAR